MGVRRVEPSWCLANGVIEATLTGNNVGNLSNIQYSLEGTTEDGRHVTVQAQKTPVFQNLAPGRYTVIVDANCQNVSNQPVYLRSQYIDVKSDLVRMHVTNAYLYGNNKVRHTIGNSLSEVLEVDIDGTFYYTHKKEYFVKALLINKETKEVLEEISYNRDMVSSSTWKARFDNIGIGNYEIKVTNGCKEETFSFQVIEKILSSYNNNDISFYFATQICIAGEKYISGRFMAGEDDVKRIEFGVQ